MYRLYPKYLDFLHSISINLVSRIGVIITSSSFVTFIIMVIALQLGFVTNAYVGLLIYLAIPSLFILGLILIPIGWKLQKSRVHKQTGELLEEQFPSEDLVSGVFGSRLLIKVAFFTLLNVLFIALISLEAFEYMDQPVFCGTACHDVMGPEWAVYQQSPHARIKCVDCHVGEKTEDVFFAKFNGVRQMYLQSINSYSRPIPTPVHTMIPARDTCEKCHWSDKFYGTKVKDFVTYDTDEESTPYYTSIALNIETASPTGREGIHWHISVENEVRYATVDDKNLTMIYVDARMDDGSFNRFTNPDFSENVDLSGALRTLDCIGCHNRPAHIFLDAETAVNNKLEQNVINTSLPYIKREALASITLDYPDKQTALTGIEDHITTFYRENYPEIAVSMGPAINEAVLALQEMYGLYIHHDMNITWGTYPNFIGHKNDSGCMRCHNDMLEDESGNTITGDCELCHSILAYDDPEPFIAK